ncbi:hypothetical protein Q4E93_33295 [Flavitalea sp. BT771]|uniref:hypothetical protein n=1 Tax=Flavitalea sp. BT771 TaxID=3063329 RepID=UPI0026E2BCCB|nr:hypothetical protein [Flavitalea sp. BT771]MDO6435538.1 hypothetical protein [Flavitalea sp. BT771]MDV6224438.1 hypothetical protein [Flavitalea sp. BT771]
MRAFLLTIISTLTVALVLGLGYNRVWFVDKPLYYWGSFIKESRSPAGPGQIRKARYGMAYTVCMQVKEAMAKQPVSNPVLLFEPNGYYRDSLHMDLHLPEPAVFYYYTGLRGVWMHSPGVEKANYFVRCNNKAEVKLEPIGSSGQLQIILARYQKFLSIL